jgi:hypothetical protein
MERGVNKCLLGDFWRDVEMFYIKRFSHGLSGNSLLESDTETFNYDVGAWIQEKCPTEVERFRFEKTETLKFFLSPDKRMNIEGAIGIWSLNKKSMSMLVRRIHHDWRSRSWKILSDLPAVLST